MTQALRENPPVAPTSQGVSTVNFTKIDKPSPKLEAIQVWLNAHPDIARDPKKSSRYIAGLIGEVSHTLVAQALKAYRSK